MLVGDLGHLGGQEECLHDKIGCVREGGGEEKWRWDGAGAPEGRLGEGRVSSTQRGALSGRGSAGREKEFQGMQPASPPTLGLWRACWGPKPEPSFPGAHSGRAGSGPEVPPTKAFSSCARPGPEPNQPKNPLTMWIKAG